VKRGVHICLLASVFITGCGCEGGASGERITYTERIVVKVQPETIVAGEPATLDFTGSKFAASKNKNAAKPDKDHCPTLLYIDDSTTPGKDERFTDVRKQTAIEPGTGHCVSTARTTVTFPAGEPGQTRTESITVFLQRQGPETILGPLPLVHSVSRTFDVRVFTPGGQPPPSGDPIAAFTYTPDAPKRGTVVNFDGSGSRDPDGRIVSYRWNLGITENDDQLTCCDAPKASARYGTPPSRTVTLTVTDDAGRTDSETKTVPIADECDPETPPHNCRRVSSRSALAAARLTGVRLRFSAKVVSLGKVTTGIYGPRVKRLVARGRMKGRVARRARVPAAVRDLYRSNWAGRFAFNLTADGGAIGRGTILARSRRDPRVSVCLSVTGDARSGKTRRNRFRVLGGTRRGARLRATGTFPVPVPGKNVGRYSVQASKGRARGLPRSCRALVRYLPRVRRR